LASLEIVVVNSFESLTMVLFNDITVDTAASATVLAAAASSLSFLDFAAASSSSLSFSAAAVAAAVAAAAAAVAAPDTACVKAPHILRQLSVLIES